MWLALLGPLAVHEGDREIVVAGARLRTLLCRLAVTPGRRVSTFELVDAVWSDDAPADTGNALQTLVSRLRRVLGNPSLIVAEPAGYRLAVEPRDLDAVVFAELVDQAGSCRGAGDLDAADEALTRALAMWRGDPLSDAGGADYAAGYRARWSELQRTALYDRFEIALLRGSGPEVVGELEELAETHPLDERFAALLLRALIASRRGAEALNRFEQTRRRLADELGTDPGPELRDLHLTLLRGDGDPATAGPAAGPAPRSNLRGWLTSFVGREDDLDRVLASVQSHRLSTLLGPGGAGKTRLASETATRWLAGQDGTAWLVELAPVTEEANIPTAILGALGLRDARIAERTDLPGPDAIDRLLDVLRDETCLLVVDNCEHLIEPVAEIVDLILAHCPGVRVLATSREPLALIGEAICPLPPLVQPPADATVTQARRFAAVQLWSDRAAVVRLDFVLDDSTVAAVVEIVRRLDGLPLAIELAAARLRVLPVAEIARRLSDRFRLLTGGHRAGLPRHRTLRAVVEWSWDLTSPEERLLAERLAVFPAGASSGTATAVCADDRLPAVEIDALLIALVDKSLLQSLQPTTGPTDLRFRMLETIREYGTERLAERGELEAARLAHARYFAELVITLEPALRSSEQLQALQTLELERENILAALSFLGDSGRGPEALRMALALVWYWSLLGSSSEAVTWLGFVIRVNEGAAPSELAFAKAALALSRQEPGEDSGQDRRDWQTRVADMAELALELAAAPAAPFPGLEALRPMVAMFAQRPDLADAMMRRALASPDRWVRAALLASNAFSADNDGRLESARGDAATAYAEFSQIGDRWGLSSCLLMTARLATLDGDLDRAVADYQEAWRLLAQLGASSDDEIFIRIRLADLYVRQGNWEQARRQLSDPAASGGPLTSHRDMFAEVTSVLIDARSGASDVALTRARDLRRRLAARPSPAGPAQHLTAIVLATTGSLEATLGDLDQAHEDLAGAYAAGLASGDMPILAVVGQAVTALAVAERQFDDAAVILGAAAEVRGADDWGDQTSVELRDRLRVEAADFETGYASGRSLPRKAAIARLDPAALRQAQGT